MEKEYYVYAYLDPRKSEIFKYEDIIFEFEPFYIGKGKGRRIYYHWDSILNETYYGTNTHLRNKLEKFKRENISPVIIKVYENLFNKEALDKEKFLIKKIGRSFLKEGPLVNITSGGDGKGSYRTRSDKGKKRNPLSNEHKNRLSISHKGKILSEEHKKKISENSISPNKTWTEESRQKLVESRRKKWPSKKKVLNYLEKYKTKILISKKLGISHPTLGTICNYYDIKVNWNKNLGINQYTKGKI